MFSKLLSGAHLLIPRVWDRTETVRSGDKQNPKERLSIENVELDYRKHAFDWI